MVGGATAHGSAPRSVASPTGDNLKCIHLVNMQPLRGLFLLVLFITG